MPSQPSYIQSCWPHGDAQTSLHVCMYVCMHVCMFVYLIYRHVDTPSMYLRLYERTWVCTMYVSMYVCIHV